MFRIPRYSGKVVEKKNKMEKTGKCKAFCFSSKRKKRLKTLIIQTTYAIQFHTKKNLSSPAKTVTEKYFT